MIIADKGSAKPTKTASKPKAKPQPKKAGNDLQDSIKLDVSRELTRYHQLDGKKNGSKLDGVQFSPVVAQDEKALRKEIDDLSSFLSTRENITFRPSPICDPVRGDFRADLAAKSKKYVESSAKLMLEQATDTIVDPTIKAMVKEGLKSVPKAFFTEPSSSTGKWHPADEINEGGLVLHTCRVVGMAQNLADYYKLDQHEKDVVTGALILHDACKGGFESWPQGAYAPDHGDVAARMISTLKNGNSLVGKELQRLAGNHMAQWSVKADGTPDPRKPADKLEQIVSYADYVASRDNIYLVPKGYDASYLNDVPVHGIPHEDAPDHVKWYTMGNKVTPLADSSVSPKDKSDDIFAQIDKMIAGAKKSIQVEMFGLGRPEITKGLIAKHKEGVKVQVVLDPVNEEYEKEKAEAAKQLTDAGIEVVWYPIIKADGETAKYDQINHVKQLIVDGDRAIIGGMNWGGHSPNNHDVDVMVEGPAVDKMEYVFNDDYKKSGGKNPLPVEKTPVHPEGKSLISVLTSSEDPKRRQIKASLFRAIKEAKKSIHVESFFLTDFGVIGALKEAKGRGVDVKVLLNPSEINGNKLNEKAESSLRAAGIEVKWFVPDEKTGSKLHAKLGVFDGEEVLLGSANWSGTGLGWNREANVSVIDKEVAGFYENMFTDDFKKGSDEPHYIENHSGAT